MHLLLRYFEIKISLILGYKMSQSQLPLLIGIGSRIRKSPYYESDLKYGVTGFTVYNKMYLPTGFSGPEKEYESLINDVTFGDFAS